MLEPCAAVPCSHEYDVWTYSPHAGGVVPTCISHSMDVVAGSTPIKDGVPVFTGGAYHG